jgi:hypothetical protein
MRRKTLPRMDNALLRAHKASPRAYKTPPGADTDPIGASVGSTLRGRTTRLLRAPSSRSPRQRLDLRGRAKPSVQAMELDGAEVGPRSHGLQRRRIRPCESLCWDTNPGRATNNCAFSEHGTRLVCSWERVVVTRGRLVCARGRLVPAERRLSVRRDAFRFGGASLRASAAVCAQSQRAGMPRCDSITETRVSSDEKRPSSARWSKS